MSDGNDLPRRGRVRKVRFPTLGPLLIKCPICSGNGCNVCNDTGEYEMEGEQFVEIQQPLIVKYIIDNMSVLSSEITRLYGKNPEVSTELVIKDYEIIRVDSLSGSVWITHNLKGLESPKYFYKKEELEKWLV